jgi:hypothetical protein
MCRWKSLRRPGGPLESGHVVVTGVVPVPEGFASFERKPGPIPVCFPKVRLPLSADPVYAPINWIAQQSPEPVYNALQWYLDFWR